MGGKLKNEGNLTSATKQTKLENDVQSRRSQTQETNSTHLCLYTLTLAGDVIEANAEQRLPRARRRGNKSVHYRLSSCSDS